MKDRITILWQKNYVTICQNHVVNASLMSWNVMPRVTESRPKCAACWMTLDAKCDWIIGCEMWLNYRLIVIELSVDCDWIIGWLWLNYRLIVIASCTSHQSNQDRLTDEIAFVVNSKNKNKEFKISDKTILTIKIETKHKIIYLITSVDVNFIEQGGCSVNIAKSNGWH